MSAVVCEDFGEWSIQGFPVPEPEENEVLVDVSRVQLSVTECQRFRGYDIRGKNKAKKQMKEGDGRVFGHEFCGEVVAKGENVTDIDIGDRVYPPGKIPCNECVFCKREYEEFCENQTSIGGGRPGALAEYVTVPEPVLDVIPDTISDAEGTAMQPFAAAVTGINDARIEAGDVVAVVGAGVMGAHCAQLAVLEGADEVFAIDVLPEKLEFMADCGFTPIDASDSDPVEAVLDFTGGVGADVSIAAVGGKQSNMTSGDDPLAQAFRMTRTGGNLLQESHISGEVSVAPRKIRTKSVDWINPRRGDISLSPNSTTGSRAVKLVGDEHVNIDRYITHVLDGLESFEEAVRITLDKPEYDALGPAQIVV